MAVGERRIGERPQMFRWLEFGRIRRQKEQVDVVRHAQALGAVPAGPIQHEHNLLVGTGSDCLGKGGEFRLEEGHAHRGGQMKDRAAGGGMDEADQVSPLVAVLDRSQGALAVKTPDLVQDRFEPNAVFIHGPQLNLRLREGCRDLAQEGAQTRLEVSLRLRVSVDMARAWHP